MKNLIDAMQMVNDLNKSHGVVQRGGKKYTEVFVRVEAFRQVFGESMGIDTQVLVDDGKRVVIKAIITKDGVTVGSGMAEEIRGSSNVNKTSALENCETSAIGRALASLGLHGGSYASANEIAAVTRKEQAMKEPAPAPKNDPEPEPQTQSTKAFENEFVLNTHLGKELARLDANDYAIRLVEMFKVYVNRDQDKDGNPVEPRTRMTFLRQLKEANQESIDMLGENMMEQVDLAYKKSLKQLGAKMGEE